MQQPHSQEEEYRAGGKVRIRTGRSELTPAGDQLRVRHRAPYRDENPSPPKTREQKQQNHLIHDLIDAEKRARSAVMLATVQRAFREAHCPIPLVVFSDFDGPVTVGLPEPVDRKEASKKAHKPRHVNLGRHGRTTGGDEKEEEELVFRVHPVSGNREAWSDWTYVLGTDGILFSYLRLACRPDMTYLHSYPDDWTWFPAERTGRPLKPQQCQVSWKDGKPSVSMQKIGDQELEHVTKQLQKAVVQEAKKDARRRVPSEEADSD